MFKLNTEITTKDGQTLMPFLVENKTVYCFEGKKTVVKKLDDFDFEPQQILAPSAGGVKMVSSSGPIQKPKIAIPAAGPVAEIARPTLEKTDIEEVETVRVIEEVKPDEVLVKPTATEKSTVKIPVATATIDPVTTTTIEKDYDYEKVTNLDGGDVELQVGGVKIIEKEVKETISTSPYEAITNEDYI